MTLKYLLIIDFPKFDPLTAAEMALCGNLGPKCQNLFPLVKIQKRSQKNSQSCVPLNSTGH